MHVTFADASVLEAAGEPAAKKAKKESGTGDDTRVTDFLVSRAFFLGEDKLFSGRTIFSEKRPSSWIWFSLLGEADNDSQSSDLVAHDLQSSDVVENHDYSLLLVQQCTRHDVYVLDIRSKFKFKIQVQNDGLDGSCWFRKRSRWYGFRPCAISKVNEIDNHLLSSKTTSTCTTISTTSIAIRDYCYSYYPYQRDVMWLLISLWY